ncbi:hypothetical protein AMTR_s00065p00205110 [Amborella trichopoda]|uniref:Uncharacterized protein n=1 Tax=Amborella trichopoda TaxID=13333 RepID=U5D892_AMBTC|nr:hypothetical protein AMTR_s00065p00205110 [Amborella trichopoda]
MCRIGLLSRKPSAEVLFMKCRNSFFLCRREFYKCQTALKNILALSFLISTIFVIGLSFLISTISLISLAFLNFVISLLTLAFVISTISRSISISMSEYDVPGHIIFCRHATIFIYDYLYNIAFSLPLNAYLASQLVNPTSRV